MQDDNENDISDFEEEIELLFSDFSNEINDIISTYNISKEFFGKYIMVKLIESAVNLSVKFKITKEIMNDVYEKFWNDHILEINNKIIDKSNTTIH